MDFVGGLSSSILSILSFALFAACVLKVFQIATTLTEIKGLLTAVKPNTALPAPATAPAAIPTILASHQSGEEMLRALSLELDHPVNPTSIELGNKS
jgi:hypothetical protein